MIKIIFLSSLELETIFESLVWESFQIMHAGAETYISFDSLSSITYFDNITQLTSPFLLF